MHKELKEIGFKSITRFEAYESTIQSLGCTTSHYLLLCKLLDQVKPPFIVLEDDAILNRIVYKIEIPDDADAVYLGNSCNGFYNKKKQYINFRHHKLIIAKRYDEELYRIYNMLATHAILYLNLDYVKMSIRSINFFKSILTDHDKGQSELLKYFNVYSFNDPIFFQEDNEKETKILLSDTPMTEYKKAKNIGRRRIYYLRKKIKL